MALTTVDQGLLGTYAQYTGFKNRIINGAMAIDQRNAGASISSGIGALAYAVDRTYTYALTAAVTAQRVASSVSGFTYALQVTGAASNSYMEVGQRIESNNCYDLNGQTVTVSAYLSASTAITVSLYAGCCTSTDNFSTAATIGSTTINVTTTPTKYTWSIDLNSNASKGVVVAFTKSGLTSGTFVVTGFQLEKGSTATSFDYRPYGTELSLCQRYFCSSFNPAYPVLNGSSHDYGGVYTCASTYNNASAYCAAVFFPVQMRAAPTVSPLSTSLGPTNGRWAWYNGTWVTCTATDVQGVKNTYAGFGISSASEWSGSQGRIVIGAWKAEAEL